MSSGPLSPVMTTLEGPFDLGESSQAAQHCRDPEPITQHWPTYL